MTNEDETKTRARQSIGFSDLSDFQPRAKPPKDPDRHIDTRDTDQAAAALGFTSREPRQRRRRPSYDGHISIRAHQRDIERFHQIADENGWKSGKLFEMLIAAFEKSYR